MKCKPKKACLLVGPPGVGKTSLARAAANDYGFQVVELNASDVRTEKAIDQALIPARTSVTLESFSSNGRGNLILMDEVDGIFGREDRGGLPAILSILKDAPVPIVLTANNVNDDRFDDLRKACTLIELHELPPRILTLLINHITCQERVKIPAETVDAIVRRSSGDIRSAVNDAQTATVGSFEGGVGRTKSLKELDTLSELFGSSYEKARRALNNTEIPLYKDELLLLLHDMIPYIYTSSMKLANAYDSLSRADVTYARIGVHRSRSLAPPPFNMPRHDSVPQWTLLPVALNEIASIGVDETDETVDHAIEVAPRISQKTIERYQYRLWSIDHASGRLAKTCHTSKRTARREILPFLIILFHNNEEKGREVAFAMELEERDIEFLISESKTTNAPSGPEMLLDPAGFKLPFMGKDKFIQLMRAGVKYDSAARRFSVRRMDNLDAVEQSLTEIVTNPVKFIRQNLTPPPQVASGKATKVCYVDGTEIVCDECEYVDDCPTRLLAGLKFCICSNTLSDPQGYEKYTSKNEAPKKEPRSPAEKPASKARKRVSSRKKVTAARD